MRTRGQSSVAVLRLAFSSRKFSERPLVGIASTETRVRKYLTIVLYHVTVIAGTDSNRSATVRRPPFYLP